MKTQRSLKLYFLLGIFLIGVVTIVGMSIVAIRYFFSGIDLVMLGSMQAEVLRRERTGGKLPVNNDGIIITSRWQDLPKQIKEHFAKNDLKTNELAKYFDTMPLISRPKESYFIIKFDIKGKTRYAAKMLPRLPEPKLAKKKGIKDFNIPYFCYIVFTAVVAIILFGLATVFIFRFIFSPTKALNAWAGSLDSEKLKQPIPDFYYIELNALAKMMQSSLSSVQSSLDREQRFLGYASHELRTPIAVTRTNTELLRKLITKDAKKVKQEEVLNRIERALFTMTDLTETLLWLNRQEKKSLPTQCIEIGALIEQINEELRYLLQGKAVQIAIHTDKTQLDLPYGLCRIIVTNLIRNALQHTQQGNVYIKQSGSEFTIENTNLEEEKNENELGFGLGLELTQRLVVQYGWYYQNIQTPAGRKVKINFA